MIDGFPRNEDNKEGWIEYMEPFTNMPYVIFIECTEETMIKRIHKRASTARLVGEEQRNDDNMDILKKRFQTFLNETMPIIDYYDQQG